MNEYSFTLKFNVPKADDLEALSASLYEGGCDDAAIGIGVPGRISLFFTRESDSASDAVLSALENVKTVVPEAKLTEAAPDLVGASDIAKILSCSRQNIQKMAKQSNNFPAPVYVDQEGGRKSTLWHLSSVLNWSMENRSFHDNVLYDLSSMTMTINLNNRPDSYMADVEEEIRLLMA